eukprot:11858511-Ditylum_brightwellii.AAC.1
MPVSSVQYKVMSLLKLSQGSWKQRVFSLVCRTVAKKAFMSATKSLVAIAADPGLMDKIQ